MGLVVWFVNINMKWQCKREEMERKKELKDRGVCVCFLYQAL